MIPARRKAMPSPWAMLFLAVCCLLSMIITYRAGAQNAGTATAPAAETRPADKDKPAAEKPDDKTDAPAAPAKGKRAPPSKAEESATIEDDPTLVPDDKESADNNVSFPIDI